MIKHNSSHKTLRGVCLVEDCEKYLQHVGTTKQSPVAESISKLYEEGEQEQ